MPAYTYRIPPQQPRHFAAPVLVATSPASPPPTHVVTGQGFFAVIAPVAVKVELAGSLAVYGTGQGFPTRYFGLGNVTWASLNGPIRNTYLEHQTELVICPFANPAFLYYSIAYGLTATITELLVP